MTEAVNDQRIFVQIAAYRDSELLPTLRDCLARADEPDRLTFGICWQRAEDEDLAEFAGRPGVRIAEVHYSQSRGACWARSRTQALYQGEAYTLQIDSHHRFAPGWDTAAKRLLLHARNAGSPKPLLTSYAPVFDPDRDPEARGGEPLRLRFNGFTGGGPFQVMPVGIDVSKPGPPLEPARFLSAHFLFTLGDFCREVPYDPKLYFFGEEPSMAIRAYTHGYDLFHPRVILLWHYYTRSRAPRHWSDNRRWWLRNERSLMRYRRLISPRDSDDDLEGYGLGNVRTLKDYEQYAGLSLADHKVRAFTLAGRPPVARALLPRPGNRLLDEYVLDISLENLPAGFGEQDGDTLCIITHSGKGFMKRKGGLRELSRVELVGDGLANALKSRKHQVRVYAKAPPGSWSVLANGVLVW